MTRQLKREVKIGNIKIGGTNPIAVQTMLNVPVKDIAGNVAQAKRVAAAGCQIVRVTVPSPSDAAVVAAIKEAVDIPVVADIHFDYRAALAALDAGADKIRINPGNIGDDDRVKAVVQACQQKKCHIWSCFPYICNNCSTHRPMRGQKHCRLTVYNSQFIKQKRNNSITSIIQITPDHS